MKISKKMAESNSMQAKSTETRVAVGITLLERERLIREGSILAILLLQVLCQMPAFCVYSTYNCVYIVHVVCMMYILF